MSNIEIAKRIIDNFIATNPGRVPMDFITRNFSISKVACFEWTSTPEGYDFWCDFYYEKLMGKDSLVKQFVLNYYFTNDLKFIDLDKMC